MALTKGEQIKPLTYAEGNGGTWFSPGAAATDPYGNGWVETRTADATEYRETFPPFEPDADYIMRVLISSVDSVPLDIPRKGKQIAAPGMNRQPKARIDQIGLLPTFYKTVTTP
jgi:hypothetical protein